MLVTARRNQVNTMRQHELRKQKEKISNTFGGRVLSSSHPWDNYIEVNMSPDAGGLQGWWRTICNETFNHWGKTNDTDWYNDGSSYGNWLLKRLRSRKWVSALNDYQEPPKEFTPSIMAARRKFNRLSYMISESRINELLTRWVTFMCHEVYVTRTP